MADNSPRVKKSDFEREIVKMAVADKNFRDQLIADPKKALKASVGFEAPPNVNIQVLQEDPTKMYLVLPLEAGKDQELGDADLDAVAGGATVPQMQTFVAGDFVQRFQTEQLGSAQMPGKDLTQGVRVSWG